MVQSCVSCQFRLNRPKAGYNWRRIISGDTCFPAQACPQRLAMMTKLRSNKTPPRLRGSSSVTASVGFADCPNAASKRLRRMRNRKGFKLCQFQSLKVSRSGGWEMPTIHLVAVSLSPRMRNINSAIRNLECSLDSCFSAHCINRPRASSADF